MSISNSYPTQTPSLNLNFATGSDQFLDSRISFSRADSTPSNVHYRSNEKHLSSENLLLQSQDFDTTWANDGSVGLAGVTGSQTAPDGTSTAWLITADTFTGQASRLQQSISISTNTEYTMVAHVKAGTASHAWMSFRGASTQSCSVTLNFSTQALTNTAFNFANVSSSVIALGNSWFKLTLTGTTDNSTASPLARIGISDGSAVAANGNADWDASGETIYAWGVQLSSVNSLVYDSPTTTQISRKYSSTLKSVTTSGQPRFEYDPTDGQSVGTAKGLLVESQVSNLATYGSDLTNAVWNPLSATAATAAIGPDGTLSAAKLTSGTGSGIHPRFRRLAFLSTSKTQTFSVYVKPLEYSYLNISQDGHSTQMVHYNLTGSGSISSASGCSGTVEQCGNGWFRISFTHTNATSSTNLAIVMQSTATYSSETGNSYDGMLFASAQLEDAAAASSFIGTTSSTVTRSADSCSVDLSDINFAGGEYTLIADADTLSDDEVFVSASLYKDNDNYSAMYANGLYGRTVVAVSDGVNSTVNGGSANGRIAVVGGTNSLSVSVNGGAVTTDTSYTVPDLSGGTLYLGTRNGSSSPLNGNLKRVSLYSVALSNVELQSLTSNP